MCSNPNMNSNSCQDPDSERGKEAIRLLGKMIAKRIRRMQDPDGVITDTKHQSFFNNKWSSTGNNENLSGH